MVVTVVVLVVVHIIVAVVDVNIFNGVVVIVIVVRSREQNKDLWDNIDAKKEQNLPENYFQFVLAMPLFNSIFKGLL